MKNFNAMVQEMKNDKAKLYIGIGVAVIVLVIVIIIIVKCTKVKDLINDKKANERLIDEANQTIVVEDISITQDQFNTFASKLYKAMKGPGTNEQAIFNVFDEMNSRSDVQQLIKTFGTKDGMTLKEWLYDDLNENDIQHINSILASKSINYKF